MKECFFDLPDELVVKILGFLDSSSLLCVSGTCTRLNRLSRDFYLWSCVDLEPFRSIMDDHQLEILLRTRFSGVPLDRPVFSSVITREPKFTSNNNNNGNNHYHKSNTNNAVLTTSKSGDHLNSLFSNSTSLFDPGIDSFSSYDESGDAVLPVFEQDLHVPPTILEDLTTLTTSGTENNGDFMPKFMLRQLPFDWFSQPFPLSRLCSLSLSRCSNITDTSLLMLSRSCPGLQRLDLTECTKISDKGISALIDGCPWIRCLILANCTDVSGVSVQNIAKRQISFSLEQISLRGCDRLFDIDIMSLAEACPRLAHLDISLCSRITDSSMFALAQMPLLQTLHISVLPLLTDRGLLSLSSSKTLTTIHMALNHAITQDAIDNLKESLQNCTISNSIK